MLVTGFVAPRRPIKRISRHSGLRPVPTPSSRRSTATGRGRGWIRRVQFADVAHQRQIHRGRLLLG